MSGGLRQDGRKQLLFCKKVAKKLLVLRGVAMVWTGSTILHAARADGGLYFALPVPIYRFTGQGTADN
jgi:hypothetical protein